MPTTESDRSVAFDHFVILLDKEDFEHPPSWLSDHFHIVEGGTHAGGSSRNKLILFKDGTYLELFNWTGQPKEFLDWADKPPGLIDFALTNLVPTTALQNFVAMSEAMHASDGDNLGVYFDHPRTGGRQRRDGVDVKWETTRPLFQDLEISPDKQYFPTQRLDVPFFCHDITDRSLRVPCEDEGITNHPCGAVGVSAVEVAVPVSYLERYVTLYEAILGVAAAKPTEHPSTDHATLQIQSPKPQQHSPSVIVRSEPELRENADGAARSAFRKRGVGIRRLILATERTDLMQGLVDNPEAQALGDGSVVLTTARQG